MPRRTLLIITQMYRPDPGAVGQYEADAAEEMARRGWRVVVLTANRGYDDPADRYAARETVAGVQVIRLPLSSFGKRSIAWRMLGGLFFVAQGVMRALLMRRIDALLISTVPPVSALAGIALHTLRRTPVVYWIMDLNPDQYVALGHAAPTSVVVRLFDRMNRMILGVASGVVVLDRFMAARVTAKREVSHKLRIIPPWSRDRLLAPVPHGENPFRERHGLVGKFVVMYSGNHGPSNPLTTLLLAARRLHADKRLVFAFVGGGVGKVEVDAAASDLDNILSLPYQSREELSFSLSAADLHVVTVGDRVVGVVHPSKVYGAFAVERPILLIGPQQSHVGDILARHALGWHAGHGAVDDLVATLERLLDAPPSLLETAGRVAKATAVRHFSAERLCTEFCDFLTACAVRPEA